jgi:hypothetical protein
MYVRIRASSGNEREVRWYNEAEYARMYPGEEIEVEVKRLRTVKDVLGFEKGYITIFKGNVEAVEDWFRAEKVCRFHNFWGWYIISTDEVPTLPNEVSAVELPWSAVSLDDNHLKPESQVLEVVQNLIYANSNSNYLGEVGQRIDFEATVIKAIPIDNYFGKQTLHIFETPDGDIATWLTGARTLEIGTTYNLRGTIKELVVYKGTKQSVMTRCTIR